MPSENSEPGVSNNETFKVPGSAGRAGFEPSIEFSMISLFVSPSDDSASPSGVGVRSIRSSGGGATTRLCVRIPFRLFKHFEMP